MASEIEKYKADHVYVKNKINQFFDTGSIKKTLDLIDEVGITGWEKWWQVEFAAWLSQHSAVGGWVMEEVFLTDLRHKTKRDRISIDLGFRLKGFSTKELIFLELKQNADWKKCIENMLTDTKKVITSQKYSESNHLMIRSFFAVGIYPTGDATKKKISDYIELRANELKINVPRECIFTKFIQNNVYSVTVF